MNIETKYPNVILIFHCDSSNKRSPQFINYLKSLEKKYNDTICYPNIYLLDCGYEHFYSRYKFFCTTPQSSHLNQKEKMTRNINELQKNMNALNNMESKTTNPSFALETLKMAKQTQANINETKIKSETFYVDEVINKIKRENNLPQRLGKGMMTMFNKLKKSQSSKPNIFVQIKNQFDRKKKKNKKRKNSTDSQKTVKRSDRKNTDSDKSESSSLSSFDSNGDSASIDSDDQVKISENFLKMLDEERYTRMDHVSFKSELVKAKQLSRFNWSKIKANTKRKFIV